jgi:uroporphyrinogen III methyltransferase/synthase
MPDTRRRQREAIPGTVYLVGAGPGDPDLLTLRAQRLLASCDVVLYDHLVNPVLLDHAPPQAERRYAGKVGHGCHHSQREIERTLIQLAHRNLRIVRLKGGDPLLFGRGGEEAAALAAAGVPYEIVPGISAALAVPTYAGIPVTHRGVASSVAIVAGHCAGECDRLPAVTAGADTIVVLMGMAHIRRIASRLLEAGRAASTPAAAIAWGTYDHQEVIRATLETLPDAVAERTLTPPAVIVIGEVVRLRDRLAWFDPAVAGPPQAQSRGGTRPTYAGA